VGWREEWEPWSISAGTLDPVKDALGWLLAEARWYAEIESGTRYPYRDKFPWEES